MSHYGIIKRQRHWIVPEWRPYGVNSYHTNRTLKYESISDKYKHCLDNIIIESTKKDEIIIYWEGEVNQPIVLIGESIEIEGEKMKVLSIDKNINGNVTYLVEEFETISPRYDELLEECNILYDQYSEHLKSEKTKERLNESWIKSMFRDLFLNNK